MCRRKKNGHSMPLHRHTMTNFFDGTDLRPVPLSQSVVLGLSSTRIRRVKDLQAEPSNIFEIIALLEAVETRLYCQLPRLVAFPQ